MAAEVFGSIVGANGVEDITLNNAATESTLKALLAATAKTPQAIEAAMNLAKSAGLDPAIAERAEQNIDRLGAGAGNLDGDFGTLQQSTKKVNINFNSIMASTGQLIEGTATFGGILNTLGGVLPKQLGFFVEMLAKAADFQARSLETYRLISSSGANFSGNLMEMRLAAAESYLTLAQFSDVVRNNSSTLAKMGGTVDSGVRAFAVLNKSLIQSDAGRQLMALGLTTEQVSNGMLTFINATGGRTKAELGNTEAITAATTTYLVELDKLTQFSGISRKEQEELQKKAAATGAYQLALSKMNNDEQRTRAAIGLAAAQTQGAGAVDLFMANIAGLPAAMTADGQKFQGMFGRAAQGITDMAGAAKSTTGSITDIRNAFDRANVGLVEGVNSIGLSGSVMSLKGDQVVNAAQLQANRLQKQGADLEGGTAKLFKEIEANQKKQGDSQAKVAADVELAVKKLGSEILALMAGPLVVVGEVLKVFAENIGKISIGLMVLGGILAAYKAYALSQVYKSAVGPAGKIDALLGGWGHSPAKALWVRVVPGGGSLGGPEMPGGGGPDDKGKGGKLGAGAKMLGKGVAGMVGGYALDQAAEYADKTGNPTTAGALDTASSGLTGFGIGSMLLGAAALAGAPLTGGASLALLAGLSATGVGIGLMSNKEKLFGSSPNIERSSEAKPSEPTLSEEQSSLVASYQKRSVENSDRLLLIMRELIDITKDQRDLIKGRPTPEAPRGPHYGNTPTR